MSQTISIDTALHQLKNGQQLILNDPASAHGSGMLVAAAEFVTPAMVHRFIQLGGGMLYLALSEKMSDRLGLRLTSQQEIEEKDTLNGMQVTLPVDAAQGITNGFSIDDRICTIQTLLDPQTTPDDLVTPGHLYPIRVRAGGVFEACHPAEGGVDLARLAGLTPALLLTPILSAKDGKPAQEPELSEIATRLDYRRVAVEDIHAHRLEVGDTNFEAYRSPGIRRAAETPLPTEYGLFTAIVYEDLLHNKEHMILRMGDLSKGMPIVRLHSECLTGDALGSLKCDCGQQLDLALSRVAEAGHGAVVYLRQEGRGIGLANKMKAYSLQAAGLDTVDANTHQGLPADGRTYGMAAAMLKMEGAHKVRLMTNNPEKVAQLSQHGIRVERVSHEIESVEENDGYLHTKADRMGHMLSFNGHAQPWKEKRRETSDD